jgi:integrase/recombinase XerD
MSELPKAGAAGPLTVHVDGLRRELAGLGFSPRTARDHGYVLAQLSRWLAAEHISPDQLTEPVLARFAGARQRKGYRRWRSRRSLRLLVDYLRRAGAIPPGGREPAGPLEMLLDAYWRYLVTERGLAPSTVAARMDVARRFLEPRLTSDGLDLETLAAADVTGFLLAQARLRSVGAVKPVTSPLRCLLRFLFVAGLVPRDLAGAVPPAASPRLASLPKAVDAATVAALLASCDRGRPVGQRDFSARSFGSSRAFAAIRQRARSDYDFPDRGQAITWELSWQFTSMLVEEAHGGADEDIAEIGRPEAEQIAAGLAARYWPPDAAQLPWVTSAYPE